MIKRVFFATVVDIRLSDQGPEIVLRKHSENSDETFEISKAAMHYFDPQHGDPLVAPGITILARVNRGVLADLRLENAVVPDDRYTPAP